MTHADFCAQSHCVFPLCYVRQYNGEESLDRQLAKAVSEKDVEGVLRAIAQGANVNYRFNDSGWTSLHSAAMAGEFDVAQVLVANQADVNARTKDGFTPLHFAIQSYNPNPDVVGLLITHGAELGARS